ncbi:MAG: HdeD family acid-resistance protein [Oscillospiraceae bacterium]
MNKVLKWLWLALSIVMIAVGVFAILNPAGTLVSMAWVIGVALLLSGICSVVLSIKGIAIPGAGWVLLDGVITTLLAIFVLVNNFFAASALPFMFGMWIIFSGVQRVINAFELRRFRVPGWGWQIAAGLISCALGIYSFTNPAVGTFAISVLVGWILISYGVSAIVLWVSFIRAEKLSDELRLGLRSSLGNMFNR